VCLTTKDWYPILPKYVKSIAYTCAKPILESIGDTIGSNTNTAILTTLCRSFFRLITIQAFDRQTDGRTDGHLAHGCVEFSAVKTERTATEDVISLARWRTLIGDTAVATACKPRPTGVIIHYQSLSLSSLSLSL